MVPVAVLTAKFPAVLPLAMLSDYIKLKIKIEWIIRLRVHSHLQFIKREQLVLVPV